MLVRTPYGNIVYLTRIGQIKRHISHTDDEADLEDLHSAGLAPPVAILIPSYREQMPVVMQTVISAALSEYPDRRVTLLIDDPPACSDADHLALCATREIVTELNELFRKAARRAGLKVSDRVPGPPHSREIPSKKVSK